MSVLNCKIYPTPDTLIKHSMRFLVVQKCSFNLSWTAINPRDCPYINKPLEEIMFPSLTGQKASPSSQIPPGKVKMLTHLDDFESHFTQIFQTKVTVVKMLPLRH